MNEHLAIKAGDKYLVLPEDFSLDYEDVNPYFNDSDSFSYPVSIPLDKNRNFVGNMDDIRSDIRPVDLEHTEMRIMVDGIPFRSGWCVTDDEQEVSDEFSFSISSQINSLTDLISDLNCRDIPVKDKIQIGEMIGNVFAKFEYDYKMEVKGKGKTGFLSWESWKISSSGYSETAQNKFELQALGFSYPGICVASSTPPYAAQSDGGKPKVQTSFINTMLAYPDKPYCNARVCYTHYKKDEDGTTSDTVSTSEVYDPYLVLEADRAQSGICFYVLYFLDCLFAYLNLAYSNAPLMKVGDLKRLAFFTTHCKYDLERKYSSKSDDDYDFNHVDQVNKWLSSRFTNGQLSLGHSELKDIEGAEVDGKYYAIGDKLPDGTELKAAYFKITRCNESLYANVMNMYANSDNFPDTSVSTVIDSLWASFGIRFLLDYETKSVKPLLIRELYRDNQDAIQLHGKIISINKISEKITGVRMKYSAESSAKEQSEMVLSGQKDYNTDYDYTDYRKVDTSLTYIDIIKKKSSTDTTCYIDLTTGNAYRLKVNADAEEMSELKPALFEVGGYKGVEVGDCSTENEDFIEELVSDFEPVIFNDVNAKSEMDITSSSVIMVPEGDTPGDNITVGSINQSSKEQILAAFVDEDMYHENTKFEIKNAIGGDHADLYVTETLTTRESYDPSNTDDGNSPLQSYDWGLAIAVMRGGGSDSSIQSYDYDYDGFGNSKWRSVSGKYALTSDSIDNWANEFDYNGVDPGIGDDERFSLKIRSYKTVDGKILCNEDIKDSHGNIVTKIRSRGLCDTFMNEHIHFLLNRQKYVVRMLCEVAELANIPNNWNRRYRVGDVTGWINKISSHITLKTGLEEVEIEMYSL